METKESHLIQQLTEVCAYSKHILAHFEIQHYTNSDFQSIIIANDINEGFFMEIMKLFEGRISDACGNLKTYPIHMHIDYLKRTHKYFIKKRLLEIEHAIDRAFKFPEIGCLLLDQFRKIKTELLEHIGHEEKDLFPYLLDLVKNGGTNGEPFYSIKEYESKHNVEVEKMVSDLRDLVKKVEASSYEILPYNLLLKILETFEIELCVHALVEDMVLIPKGLELEQELGLF